MTEEEFEDYLAKRYKPEIKYEERSAKYKQLYHVSQWLVIGLSDLEKKDE